MAAAPPSHHPQQVSSSSAITTAHPRSNIGSSTPGISTPARDSSSRFYKKLQLEIATLSTSDLQKYVDYQRLRKQIKKIVYYQRDDPIHTQKAVDIYWCVIQAEVDKINNYYLVEEQALATRLDALQIDTPSANSTLFETNAATIQLFLNVLQQQHPAIYERHVKYIRQLVKQEDAQPITYTAEQSQFVQQRFTQFLQLCEALESLRKYVVLNYIILLKVLKKFDKHTAQSTIDSYLPQLVKEPFYASEKLVQLLRRAEAISQRYVLVDARQASAAAGNICHICTRSVDGLTTLGCGHSQCSECAAKQAPNTNICMRCQILTLGTASLHTSLLADEAKPSAQPGSASARPTIASTEAQSVQLDSVLARLVGFNITPKNVSPSQKSKSLTQRELSSSGTELSELSEMDTLQPRSSNAVPPTATIMENDHMIAEEASTAGSEDVRSSSSTAAPRTPPVNYKPVLSRLEVDSHHSGNGSDNGSGPDSPLSPSLAPGVKLSCHQCKTTKDCTSLLYCATKAERTTRTRKCRKKYCNHCLRRSYNIHMARMSLLDKQNWICPACLNECACAMCQRKASGEEYGVTKQETQLPPSMLQRQHSHSGNKRQLSATEMQQLLPQGLADPYMQQLAQLHQNATAAPFQQLPPTLDPYSEAARIAVLRQRLGGTMLSGYSSDSVNSSPGSGSGWNSPLATGSPLSPLSHIPGPDSPMLTPTFTPTSGNSPLTSTRQRQPSVGSEPVIPLAVGPGPMHARKTSAHRSSVSGRPRLAVGRAIGSAANTNNNTNTHPSPPGVMPPQPGYTPVNKQQSAPAPYTAAFQQQPVMQSAPAPYTTAFEQLRIQNTPQPSAPMMHHQSASTELTPSLLQAHFPTTQPTPSVPAPSAALNQNSVEVAIKLVEYAKQSGMSLSELEPFAARQGVDMTVFTSLLSALNSKQQVQLASTQEDAAAARALQPSPQDYTSNSGASHNSLTSSMQSYASPKSSLAQSPPGPTMQQALPRPLPPHVEPVHPFTAPHAANAMSSDSIFPDDDMLGAAYKQVTNISHDSHTSDFNKIFEHYSSHDASFQPSPFDSHQLLGQTDLTLAHLSPTSESIQQVLLSQQQALIKQLNDLQEQQLSAGGNNPSLNATSAVVAANLSHIQNQMQKLRETSSGIPSAVFQ